ncbi:MAG: dihydroorotase [Bacillota bacterium]|nr:dihydroorotase [Bacillota bacterium]
MKKTLIKNVQVTDHRGSKLADVLIEGKTIKEIGQDLKADENTLVIDGTDKVLMPSFVDLHVHFRDPGLTYKEDIESGSRAALKGGYTICYAMANTKPVCDNMEVHDYVINKSKDLDLIDLYQIIAVTKNLEGKELTDFGSFGPEVKFLSDDGKGILSNHIMYQACLEAKKHGLGIMVHGEDPEISPYNYRLAEDIITLRDTYLSKETGARIHFSHVSTAGSVDIIRKGKAEGANITCETSPHHLYFAGGGYRVNPPIREEADVKALIEGIKDGTVDCIATDHAPHSKEDKEKGAPGMVGLETAFSTVYTVLVESGEISLEKLSEIMAYKPGKILDLDHGQIDQGALADLVLVDLNKEYVVEEGDLVSKSKNSPFIGEKLKGQVVMTFRQGRIMYGGTN